MRKNNPSKPSRIPIPAIAALLIAIGTIAHVDVANAEESAAMKTACTSGFASCDGAPEFTSTPAKSNSDAAAHQDVAVNKVEEYLANCYTWPATGAPPEHLDDACDRSLQNAAWAAEDAHAKAVPVENRIPHTVYLNLPEEKTWICPLDTVEESMMSDDVNNSIDPKEGGVEGSKSNNYAHVGTGAMMGHPTKWIVHNEATSPIVLTHVNPLGLEVSAMDFRTNPAHANTAIYPHGPIVVPGQIAVVNGLQGQMFIAREYKEVLPMHAMNSYDENDGVGHSWKSFMSVLPSTLSFLPDQSRYMTNKGVEHVLGRPGRVLMKHRMGNIYVKNQFGAMCPELMGGESDSADDGRRGSPKDMNPSCNILRKAFINKVGCPVDIYFAPQNKKEGFNCEKFTNHLGPLDSFLSSNHQTRDIEGHDSPLKFSNTYNGHSFVARMSHDQSLVARIELHHDVIKDCPEPTRTGVGVEVRVDERMLQGVLVDAMLVNATKSVYVINSDVLVSAAQVNATASSIHGGKPLKEMRDLRWHNRTGSVAASMPMAS
eukprot:CAMPEP_0196143476 /NCGR_PEP_ID=MMETSP0910-20130528/13459_1 /TAXON_ID=49265 /ORGANISM="Thalassiosira rotula, Strain GSO102" /LENGTH=542 /DNA_ID=CAMNT_0041404941 /DNA_START=1 /DNA_END=1629 /DNA_ORIENTATION=-